ncbi:MAG: SH3 domain-containing protein [Deltaproteobacteria bacterium]|nr:SH3 domain-containing protein [Deltaproteobacteria bacterium]
MRNRLLVASVVCGFLAGASARPARAEEVKTTHTTKILKRPGEQAPVVVRVDAGRSMTVLASDGRWLKVRVNGRTGWVTRSQVASTASARGVQRNTRRRPFVDGRSVRRGWSGDAPEDRVGADATDEDDREEADEADEPAPRAKKPAKKPAPKARHRDRDDDEVEESEGDEAEEAEAEPARKTVTVVAEETDLRAKPSRRGKAVTTVAKGDRLAIVGEDDSGEWLEVENQDGDSGWIRAKEVSSDTRAPRVIRADARIGFAALGQNFRSNGTGTLANYKLGSSAIALAIGGGIDVKYKTDFRLGADLGYVGGRAQPGIRYTDGTTSADIGFVTHDIDLRAKLGYDWHKANGMVAWGKVGYHYGMFAVANVGDFTKNLAKIPSENLSGPTAGLALEIPRLSPKLGAVASADVLFPGKRVQTKGLEDGAASKVIAVWASGLVSYQWKSSVTLDAGYQLSYAKTTWAGAAAASMRGTASTAAARSDVTHTITVGLGKRF